MSAPAKPAPAGAVVMGKPAAAPAAAPAGAKPAAPAAGAMIAKPAAAAAAPATAAPAAAAPQKPVTAVSQGPPPLQPRAQAGAQPAMQPHPGAMMPMAMIAPPPMTVMVQYPVSRPMGSKLVQKSNGTRGEESSCNTMRATRRPASCEARLIIDFMLADYCSRGIGFHPWYLANVPPQLLAVGVTPPEWQYWMQMHKNTVQSKFFSCGLWSIQMMHGCLVCCTPCCLLSHLNTYQRATRAWMAEFNRTVFEPRGLYAKMQTATYRNDSMYDKDVSWLAIALNPVEAQMLRNEPNLWRFRYVSTSCCDCNPMVEFIPYDKDFANACACCGESREV